MEVIEQYFKKTDVFIQGNTFLRYPQRRSYRLLKESFENNPSSHKVLVLPTGTGKTGVIGIVPYGISEGRVLVITPNLIIRQGISDEFDTRTPFNFWTDKKVILDEDNLPGVYRYAGYSKSGDKKRVLSLLKNANIVIANIHKVYKENSRKTLVNILDSDFFDMIIIDEAHHSAAESWENTIKYFNAKKIVKLTATPYRGDDKALEGDIVYEYELADAIKDGFVKNLVSEDYTNQKLQFEVDGKLVDKAKALEQMDKAWVTRSVAYSEECSRTIVEMSVNRLKEKRRLGNCHHQIIAVACSIEHAKQIKRIYEEYGITADYVTSDQPEESENKIIEYKKGQIDVIVNVNMLGEGFDHSSISIAAIFRPFRTLAPYAQFIGRALRKIKGDNPNDDIDNVANVIYHKELDLDDLWEYYTNQKEKANKRRIIQTEVEREDCIFRSRDIGKIQVDGKIIRNIKSFLSDGVVEKYSTAIKKEIEKIEGELKTSIEKMQAAGISDSDIKEFEKAKRKALDQKITDRRNKLRDELIREELHKYHKDDKVKQIANLISETELDAHGTELPNNTRSAYLKNATTNEAYINMYINSTLKMKIKRGIDEWETYDFEEARKLLPEIIEALRMKIIERVNLNEKTN